MLLYSKKNDLVQLKNVVVHLNVGVQLNIVAQFNVEVQLNFVVKYIIYISSNTS